MDIRDLDYFLACCDAGSFTAAARNAHIVQSAMSSAIARLERDLGVPLFDRGSTPVTLTEHGMALQAAAHRILDAVQDARDEVAAVSGNVRGTVTLGCTLNTGPLDLAAVMARIRDRYPDVIIKLRQHSTGSAGNLQALRDGTVDIALYAAAGNAPADVPPRGIVLHHLVSEAIVFVCRPDHPLAGRDRVSVADLRDERLLRFPPGWGVRTVVDNALGATQSAVEIVDYGLMTRLVRAGFGTTLVPTKGIEGERGAGLVAIPVDDPRMSWNLAAAISADRRLTAATRTLLDAIIQGAAEARQQAQPSQLRAGAGTGPEASSLAALAPTLVPDRTCVGAVAGALAPVMAPTRGLMAHPQGGGCRGRSGWPTVERCVANWRTLGWPRSRSGSGCSARARTLWG